jgi:anti-sigma-K factor RskA
LELQEFISSGVLESYVLGNATAGEIKLIREMEKIHPEIRKEIEEIEASLMRYAEADADMPFEKLKEKLMSQLFETKPLPKKTGSVVNIRALDGSPKWMRYAVAASVGLLIGVSAFTITLYDKLDRVMFELMDARAQNEVIVEELGKQLDILTDQAKELSDKKMELAMIMKPDSKMIKLKGLDIAPDATAMVLWNTKDKQVFINTASLPVPPPGKQYQLWALVDGKPVDAGVFDVTDGTFAIQQMKDMPEAQAFAVTLENAGGSPSPTMEAMYLMGKV